jgi:integrase
MSALPKPTTAPLPNEARRAVQLSLSRVLGGQRGGRVGTHTVARILAALSGLEVVTVVEKSGKKRIAEPSCRTAKRAFRSLEMTPSDLDDLWAVTKGGDQLLPEEVVLEFFPEELWPAVWMLIELGPYVARERIDAIFSCWALGKRLDGSARRRGKMSAGSLDSATTRFWQLFDAFVHLHGLATQHRLLCFQQWSPAQRPKRLDIGKLKASYAKRNRSAPPLLAARRLLRQLNASVERGHRSSDPEATLFKHLRIRAIIALLMVLGTRRGAFAELNVGDYERKHVFPDGTVGPALRVPPIKTQDAPRYKGLPDQVARWLEEYLECARIAEDVAGPMWRPRWRSRSGRLTAEAIELSVVNALDGIVPNRRFSPHTLRHLAEQVAFRAGHVWLEECDDPLAVGFGQPSSPQTFSDCLLDHELNDVVDAYKDIGNNEECREFWSRVAAVGAWEFLWGDRGARKGPDLMRVNIASLALADAEEEVRTREVELDALEQEALSRAAELTTKQLVTMLMQVSRHGRLLASAKESRERAMREHADALKARVPLPDDDLERIPDATAGCELADSQVPDTRPVLRSWCTPEEFRWAFGEDILPKSTLRRWLSGRLPYPAGDRRNIFDPPAAPGALPDAVVKVSERKYRILIDRIDVTRLHPYVVQRLDEVMRRPQGVSH